MSSKKVDLLRDFLTENAIFKSVLDAAWKVAATDIPILIEGEIGTGKERLARAIHFASPRAEKDFVIVDCAGISETMLECELFGYLRGSFVGAIHEKKGLAEIANGGTLFFDQVSELKPRLQVKLLRFIEEGAARKLGSVSATPSDVRFIFSTDKDLKALVEENQFRQDLYYRLSVMRLMIPPLRERAGDIIPLAEYFLKESFSRKKSGPKTFNLKARQALQAYEWPGNVQELEQEMEKAAVLSATADQVQPGHLSRQIGEYKRLGAKIKQTPLNGSLKAQKRKVVALLEKAAITDMLKKTQGNRTKTAKLLAISRQELIRKIAAHKIKL